MIASIELSQDDFDELERQMREFLGADEGSVITLHVSSGLTFQFKGPVKRNLQTEDGENLVTEGGDPIQIG